MRIDPLARWAAAVTTAITTAPAWQHLGVLAGVLLCVGSVHLGTDWQWLLGYAGTVCAAGAVVLAVAAAQQPGSAGEGAQ